MSASNQAETICLGALFERDGRRCSVELTRRDTFLTACGSLPKDHHFDLYGHNHAQKVQDFARLEDIELLDEVKHICQQYPGHSATLVISGKLPLHNSVMKIPASINIYGPREHKDAVNEDLNAMGLYLQNPISIRLETVYDSPQRLGPAKQTDIGKIDDYAVWSDLMRLFAYNFIIKEEERDEFLLLIRPNWVSGQEKAQTREDRIKALDIAKKKTTAELTLTECPCFACHDRHD